MSGAAPTIYYVDLAEARRATGQLTPQQYAVLSDLEHRLGAQSSTEQIIDFLFETTQQVSPCDRISVAFVEDVSQQVVAHYTRATYGPLQLRPGYRGSLAGSSLRRVLTRGQARVINDLSAYGREHPESHATKLLLEEGVRANLTCPLAVDGRFVGLLFRSSRQSLAYTREHAILHAAVAERLGQAVEKTWRIEQLAEAQRGQAEMLAFVTHELKSPVTSLMQQAQMLRDGYLGDMAPPQREALERMIAKGRYLLDLVRDYLDLARVEGGALECDVQDAVDFGQDILAAALQVVDPQRAVRRIAIDQEVTAAALSVDPNLLRIVMVNLLSNAIKYNVDEGQVRVKAATTDDGLRVTVWNSGPGFAEDQRERLFRRFSRLDNEALREVKGTGVGLYTVWRIVELHGGRVWARSEEGQWAEFGFMIPQTGKGSDE